MSLPQPAAVAELLKPITWFPPMWAFACGVISSGQPASGQWPVIAAGILLAPVTLIDINMGLAVALKSFAAAVLGGFGSIPGALVGGLIIGVIETLAGFYLPQGWKDVTPYIVLLIVLLIRPQGLFGLSMRKKV